MSITARSTDAVRKSSQVAIDDHGRRQNFSQEGAKIEAPSGERRRRRRRRGGGVKIFRFLSWKRRALVHSGVANTHLHISRGQVPPLAHAWRRPCVCEHLNWHEKQLSSLLSESRHVSFYDCTSDFTAYAQIAQELSYCWDGLEIMYMYNPLVCL